MVRILELCAPYCTACTEHVCRVRYGVRNFSKRHAQLRWWRARRAQERRAHFRPAAAEAVIAAAKVLAEHAAAEARSRPATAEFMVVIEVVAVAAEVATAALELLALRPMSWQRRLPSPRQTRLLPTKCALRNF